MNTQIKKWGDSLVIVLNKEFLDFYKLKEGDWLDISDVTKVLPYEPSSKKMLKEIKDEVDPIGTRSRK